MTTREKLTKEYIDISRQMAIKHEEARNREYTTAERHEAQVEFHRLQEICLQIMWKLEAV